jgi:putative flippase GtrA
MTGGPAGRSLVSKMVRFGAVGVANSLIDLCIFSVLLWFGAAPLLSNLLGWFGAVCFSYFANSRWSFERAGNLRHGRSFLRFFTLGAIVTLGVSSGAIVALGGLIGILPAKITGLVVAAVISFLAARWSIEDRVL